MTDTSPSRNNHRPPQDDDDPVVRRPGQRDGGGAAPMKACPQCQEMVLAAAVLCSCCGFEFPRGDSSLEPLCHWHTAVFTHLFRTLVHHRAEAREVLCGADGGGVCRFEVRLGLGPDRWHRP